MTEFAGLPPVWDPVIEAEWRVFPTYPSAIAIALGKKALHLIPKQTLRTSVFLFVLVLGAKYLLMGR